MNYSQGYWEFNHWIKKRANPEGFARMGHYMKGRVLLSRLRTIAPQGTQSSCQIGIQLPSFVTESL